MDQPTVLIISDDVEFSRSITARWQMERHVPMFTLLSGGLWPRSVENFAVAIVGPLRRELLSVVLEPLHSTQQPLFCVCKEGATAELVRERWPRTSVLRCDGFELPIGQRAGAALPAGHQKYLVRGLSFGTLRE